MSENIYRDLAFTLQQTRSALVEIGIGDSSTIARHDSLLLAGTAETVWRAAMLAITNPAPLSDPNESRLIEATVRLNIATRVLERHGRDVHKDRLSIRHVHDILDNTIHILQVVGRWPPDPLPFEQGGEDHKPSSPRG